MSLVLCVALGFSCVASLHRHVAMMATAGHQTWRFQSHRGTLGVGWNTRSAPDYSWDWYAAETGGGSWRLLNDCQYRWGWFGVQYLPDRKGRFAERGRKPWSGSITYRAIMLPHWLAIAATAVLPALWTKKTLRRWRVREGACAACGYDLRATPDRCPECGAAPPAAAEPRG